MVGVGDWVDDGVGDSDAECGGVTPGDEGSCEKSAGGLKNEGGGGGVLKDDARRRDAACELLPFDDRGFAPISADDSHVEDDGDRETSSSESMLDRSLVKFGARSAGQAPFGNLYWIQDERCHRSGRMVVVGLANVRCSLVQHTLMML